MSIVRPRVASPSGARHPWPGPRRGLPFQRRGVAAAIVGMALTLTVGGGIARASVTGTGAVNQIEATAAGVCTDPDPTKTGSFYLSQ